MKFLFWELVFVWGKGGIGVSGSVGIMIIGSSEWLVGMWEIIVMWVLNFEVFWVNSSCFRVWICNLQGSGWECEFTCGRYMIESFILGYLFVSRMWN